MSEPRYKIGDHLCLMLGGGVGLRVYRVERVIIVSSVLPAQYRLFNVRLQRLDEAWVNERDLAPLVERGTDALTSGMGCPIVPCLKCVNCCAGGGA